MKLTLRNTVLLLTEVIFLTSCASAPPTIIHEMVGPVPDTARETTNGFLLVYTAKAWAADDDGPRLLVPTDYEIDDADGTSLRHVSTNHEDPDRVVLPAGTYTVVGESDAAGTVRVPIAIESGKTTVLHLERDRNWTEAVSNVATDKLVRLPNGQPLGFSAQHTNRAKIHHRV